MHCAIFFSNFLLADKKKGDLLHLFWRTKELQYAFKRDFFFFFLKRYRFLLLLSLFMSLLFPVISSANLTVLVAVASTVCCILWRKNTGHSLPPRAPGYIPFLGHVFQLIKPVPLHELFYKWSLQVGPVFTCDFGTQKWIIVNSAEAVKNLIVERGAIYSSRNLPESITQDIFQGGKLKVVY